MFQFLIIHFCTYLDSLINRKLLLRSIPYLDFIVTENLSDFSDNVFHLQNTTLPFVGFNKTSYIEKYSDLYKLKIGNYYVCVDKNRYCNPTSDKNSLTNGNSNNKDFDLNNENSDKADHDSNGEIFKKDDNTFKSFDDIGGNNNLNDKYIDKIKNTKSENNNNLNKSSDLKENNFFNQNFNNSNDKIKNNGKFKIKQNKCLNEKYEIVNCDICKTNLIQTCSSTQDLWQIEYVNTGFIIKQDTKCLTIGYKLFLDDCKTFKNQIFGFEDYELQNCVENKLKDRKPETKTELIDQIKTDKLIDKLKKIDPEKANEFKQKKKAKDIDDKLEAIMPGIKDKPEMKRLWGNLWKYNYSGWSFPKNKLSMKMFCTKWF